MSNLHRSFNYTPITYYISLSWYSCYKTKVFATSSVSYVIHLLLASLVKANLCSLLLLEGCKLHNELLNELHKYKKNTHPNQMKLNNHLSYVRFQILIVFNNICKSKLKRYWFSGKWCKTVRSICVANERKCSRIPLLKNLFNLYNSWVYKHHISHFFRFIKSW